MPRRGAHLCVGLAAACAVSALGPGLAASASARQPLQIVLTLRVDDAGLQRFAWAVATPGSSEYRRYQTVSALARRFGAPPRERRAVISWLKAHGASHVRIDATGSLAEASMDAAQARRLFSGNASVAAFGPDAASRRVPPQLRGNVTGVLGLEPTPIATQAGLRVRAGPGATAAASQPSSELKRSGTPSGCAGGVGAGEVGGDPSTAAFTPIQYLTAYDFGPLYSSGLFGQGQRVALIEADGVKRSDLATFASCWGLRVPRLKEFHVGVRRTPAPGGEATLDAEVLNAAAPALGEIDLYETKLDITDVLTALTAPLDRQRNPPSVISVSLGACDPVVGAALGRAGLQASQFAIQTATSAGITVVAASGDTGSAGCQRTGRPPLHRLAVLYPASSWFVTAVGGTNLFLTGSNQIADEVVWNDAGLHLGASGGGLSSIWTRPPYQNGIVAANSRAVPDVSLLADIKPGYAIFCTTRDCRRGGHTGWLSAGGTSAAAPLFAGGLALINQLLKARNQEYLGFINPLIYSIGESQLRSQYLNDVTRIGNDIGPFIPGANGRPLGCCTAGPGYDEASGWGSVDLAQLARFAIFAQPQSLGAIRVVLPPHQHPLAKGSLTIRISCSRSCYAIGYVVIRPPHSGPISVYSHGFHLGHAGSKRVRLRLTRPQLRKLRSALAHGPIKALAYGVLTNSHFSFQKYSAPVSFAITS